jgi:hypothetical protein
MAGKDDDGRVGYKRPPANTSFKPGRSGNPKGRPRHARNLKTEFLEELCEPIRVREGDREMKISKQRALVKSLIDAAIKGECGLPAPSYPSVPASLATSPKTTNPNQPPPTILRFSTSSSGAKSGAAPRKATRMVSLSLNHNKETSDEK